MNEEEKKEFIREIEIDGIKVEVDLRTVKKLTRSKLVTTLNF